MDDFIDDKITAEMKELSEKLKNLNESRKPKLSPVVIWVGSITCALVVLSLTWVVIMSIRDNAFSLESILSVLLAFFSIFISILFYFKAAETSAEFYHNSYRFMKDNSVTLGKIEERFGAQLSSIQNSTAKSDTMIHDLSLKIENTEADQAKIIKEYIESQSALKESDKGFIDFKEQIENTNGQLEAFKNRLKALEKEREKYPFSIPAISDNSNLFSTSYMQMNPDGTLDTSKIGLSSSTLDAIKRLTTS